MSEKSVGLWWTYRAKRSKGGKQVFSLIDPDRERMTFGRIYDDGTGDGEARAKLICKALPMRDLLLEFVQQAGPGNPVIIQSAGANMAKIKALLGEPDDD